MDNKRRSTQHIKKTRNAIKKGYVDVNFAHSPTTSGSFSLEETYMDVYSSLKRWERDGALGAYGLMQGMCKIDRMRFLDDLDKLKKTSTDRNIKICDLDNEELNKTEYRPKGLKKYINDNIYSSNKKKQDVTPHDDISSPSSVALSKRRQRALKAEQKARREQIKKQQRVTESEYLDKSHGNPSKVPVWEHAPLTVEKTYLNEIQNEKISKLSSFESFETFFYRIRNSWTENWIGKPLVSFIILQKQKLSLRMHGIACSFCLEDPVIEDKVFVRCAVSFKINETGRYYVKVVFRAMTTIQFLQNISEKYTKKYTKDGKEEPNDCSHYCKLWCTDEEIIEVCKLYTSFILYSDVPERHYFCCICK